jgi:hypothetical protein
MICNSCGQDVEPGARYCPSCGTSVSTDANAAASPSSQPLPPPPPPPSDYFPAPAPPPMQLGPTTGTNGLAIASLVLGIIWLYWVGSVLALVFGYVALNQIKKTGGQQAGRGMAIAGVVLGWVGVGILVVAVIAGAASS